MNKAKRSVRVLRDWVELYIPVASFVLMFLVFVLQIFCRYVLRAPVQWAYEVTVSCYLWLVVLGACYAQRQHAHVTFTLIYDKLGTRMKALSALLGNALIVFAFVWSYVPSVKFIAFMARQETSILHIGLNIVYAPYIVFLTMMIWYAVTDIVRDFKIVAGRISEDEAAKIFAAQKTEVEEAIEEAIKTTKEEDA